VVERQVVGLVGGEEHHHGGGRRSRDLAGGLDAVDAGQVDVHQHRPGCGSELDRFLATLGLTTTSNPALR
jgi:hypothetical protein